MKEGAIRVTMAAFSGMTDSRSTGSVGYRTRERERVVGMPRAFIAEIILVEEE